MIFDPQTGKARMTAAEKAELRRSAAKQGYAVNDPHTVQECLEATVNALPHGVVEDILRFVETGESSLTSCSKVSEFEERLVQISES